jgi:hypothetical protein
MFSRFERIYSGRAAENSNGHPRGATVKKILSLLGLALLPGAFYFVAPLNAQSQTPAPKIAEKTSGETYKNVQVLKDVPASQLGVTMWFIQASLGVPCQHCHVAAYESDDKQAKLTARKMIQMTRDINAANFGGKSVVTCDTCHQGNIQPGKIPGFWNKSPEQIAAYVKESQPSPSTVTPAAPAQPASPEPSRVELLPSTQTVYANYRKAVGTTSVTSMHMKGEVKRDIGRNGPLEINVAYPDKFEQIGSTPAGQFELRILVNGDHGWNATPAGTTEIPQQQVALAKTNPVFFPLKYAAAEEQGKVTAIEKIGDRSYYVVEWSDSRTRSRLYFDIQSGLLFKYRQDWFTPFGDMPSETIYEDYREASGIKMPALIVSSDPTLRQQFKFSEIQFNILMDPKRFEPPAPPAAPK